MSHPGEPAHEMISIAYAIYRSLNRHAQLSSGSRDPSFDHSLYLQLFFVCASSEGSDETVRLRSLA